MLNPPIYIDGMLGMGDTIYQRAFVKQLPAGTFIKTAWPELYEDLPVNAVRSDTALRTQRKMSFAAPQSFIRRHRHARRSEYFTVRMICGAVRYSMPCAASSA